MPGNEKGVAPNGNKASVTQTETRRKVALENIKNGKKATAEELLKQREAEGKKNFKGKSKTKKVDNPEFERDNVDALLSFVERCGKSLGTKLIMVPVNNKTIPEEWVLTFKNRKILHLAPRSGQLFTSYIFLKSSRDIIKIHNQKEMDDVFARIKARCNELDKEPEPKPKKSKNGKGRQKSVMVQLEEMERKAKSYKDSNGFSLGKIKATPDVVAWCEKKGYTLQSKSIKW